MTTDVYAYLQYGSYSHEPGETRVSIRRVPGRSKTGVRYSLNQQWHVSGTICYQGNQGEASLATKVAALNRAYSVDGYNIRMVQSSGATIPESVISSQTLGGTRVIVAPSFSPDYGAELVNRYPYTLVVEGEVSEYRGPLILDYREEIKEFGDGGPLTVVIETLEGDGVKQRVTDTTTRRVIQQGYALGLHGWPNANTPKWPDDLDRGVPPMVSRTLFRSTDGHRDEHLTEWRYAFHASGKLRGGIPQGR